MFPFVGEDLGPVIDRARTHLSLWHSFPVGAEPRPVVMLGEMVEAPRNGFASGDHKEAFLQASFTLACEPPDGPDDEALISAEEALDRFRLSGSGGGARPLTITAMRLGTGTFTTDRGHRELPAWLIRFREVEHDASVLALTADSLFPLPAGASRAPPLGVAGTERSTSVLVHFVAGPPASQDFDVVTVHDDTGVAIVLRMTRNSRGPGVHTAVGHRHEVRVHLDEPIGHRIVIDGRTGALTALHA